MYKKNKIKKWKEKKNKRKKSQEKLNIKLPIKWHKKSTGRKGRLEVKRLKKRKEKENIGDKKQLVNNVQNTETKHWGNAIIKKYQHEIVTKSILSYINYLPQMT